MDSCSEHQWQTNNKGYANNTRKQECRSKWFTCVTNLCKVMNWLLIPTLDKRMRMNQKFNLVKRQTFYHLVGKFQILSDLIPKCFLFFSYFPSPLLSTSFSPFQQISLCDSGCLLTLQPKGYTRDSTGIQSTMQSLNTPFLVLSPQLGHFENVELYRSL